MPLDPCDRDEFHSAVVLEAPIVPKLSGKGRLHLYALREELSLMDCVIPLTSIPDGAEADDGEDTSLAGLNLFGAASDTGDDLARTNMLRNPRLSRAEQGRVVALRRRTMRSHLQRRPAVWRASGGQSVDDLHQMRTCIYTPTPEQLAGEAKPSVPLRLATHAIGLSLLVTALPVGAAMMTYNLLKGEDIKATARLTTLTGLALAVLAGNPQLAQLIGA